MAIIGFSRSAKMGVSAIVGLGNKSDIDEDDLLTFFEQDRTPDHRAALRGSEGRPRFAEVAKRVSKKKPIVVLKAGRTSMGAQGGEFAHRRARRQRQDLRRRVASSPA
jgi:acyl-CoA synthetase (NDP forming)